MKAEQRKELETNTLADRMGHMMKRVKTGERRTYVIYGLIAVALVAAAWVGYRWYYGDVEKRSMQWVMFHDGHEAYIKELANLEQQNVAKAARLQFFWHHYWNSGIK